MLCIEKVPTLCTNFEKIAQKSADTCLFLQIGLMKARKDEPSGEKTLGFSLNVYNWYSLSGQNARFCYKNPILKIFVDKSNNVIYNIGWYQDCTHKYALRLC